LKAQAGKFLLESPNGFRKGRSCIGPLFSMKLLIEKKESIICKPNEHLLITCKSFTDFRENCLEYSTEKRSQFIIEKYNRNLLKQHQRKEK